MDDPYLVPYPAPTHDQQPLMTAREHGQQRLNTGGKLSFCFVLNVLTETSDPSIILNFIFSTLHVSFRYNRPNNYQVL